MCGIAGIISLNNRFNSQEESNIDLKCMLDSMTHRGPDDYGLNSFENTIFGMRRLSIIDIEGGHQPISNEDDSIWVIMNGEIYNYIELRLLLIKRGHIFKTNSDTEVILHLYEDYGENFVTYLNGMFAIYLFDKKKQLHYIFRDRMGIKPLFFAEKNNNFFFSSDLTSISKILNSKFSKKNIASYLFLSYVPKPETIYENIKKVLPGQAILINNNGNIKSYFYWKIIQNIDNTVSRESAAIKLKDLLVDSTNIQMRTDSEFAISLSGGIDSTAVLAFSKLSSNKQLNTISIKYDGKSESKDSMFAKKMSEHFKTNHHEVTLKREYFLSYINDILPLIDEPISDSALIPSYIVSKVAKENGIKVILSGAGADEIFGGYHRHWRPKLFSVRGTLHYPKLVRQIQYNTLKILKIENNNKKLINQKLAFASDINGLNYTFLQNICNKEIYESQIQILNDHYRKINFNSTGYQYNKMYDDSENYLVDNILSLNDKATMAASVEGRFPIIDHRIVELAFTLPPSINMHQNNPKGLFKEVLKEYVPSYILNRKKEGFNAPINSWFASIDQKEVLDTIMNGSEEYLSDIIDLNSIKENIQNIKLYNNISENLYNLYLLIQWFKSRKRND